MGGTPSGTGGRVVGKGPVGSGFSEVQNSQGGFHRTLYNPNANNHISWDTNASGDYVKGTGHEDNNGRAVKQWDH